MSVVVAYRRGGRVAVACDAMISDNEGWQPYGRPKWVVGADGWLFSAVGDLVEMQDAERRWRAGRARWTTPEERVDKWATWARRRWPEKRSRPTFLIAHGAGAWVVSDDCDWLPVDGIDAIGSAAPEAKAAARAWATARPGDDPLHVVEAAVVLTVRWNKHVGLPVYGTVIGSGIETPVLYTNTEGKL